MEGTRKHSQRKWWHRMAQSTQSSTHLSERTERGGNGPGTWWNGLSALQRRSYLAIVTGFLAFLLLVGLLPMAQDTWLAAFSSPVVRLFGWGAWGVLASTIITCALLLHSAFSGQPHVRVVALFCLGVALVALLVESRIVLGAPTGGMVGGLGVRLLAHLSGSLGQLIIWGTLVLDTLLFFGISWHDVGHAAHAVTRQTRQQPTSEPVMPPLAASASGVSMPVPPTAHASYAINDPLQDADPFWTSQPNASQTERTVVLTQPLDYHAESTLESLRVPAYLRRGMTQVYSPEPPSVAVTTASGAYALPPLPGMTYDPPTIMLMPRPVGPGAALPPLPPQQGMGIEREAAYHPRPLTPERTTLRASQPITWTTPPLHLLHPAPDIRNAHVREHAERMAEHIERTLKSFGVEVEVRKTDISMGPTIIRFGVRPMERVRKDDRGRVMVDANGEPIIIRTRVSRIMNLKDDLALALEVKTLRMEAPVPERPYVGIEIPNLLGRMVTLREMLESREFQEAALRSKLTVALGRDVAGRVRVGDLARFPHLLIAGATGAGKSVCLSTIIGSLITQATPDEVRLVMIDPKMVELTLYAGIPHLLTPVITDARRATDVLQAALGEMERRYRLFSKLSVRNLDSYDALRANSPTTAMEKLPRIVIIIDELADLMMVASDEIERHICRLAQLARAVGIHLIVATQRPSVDVITGLIKANIPTRIAFMVSSAVDSRTILDHGGAEHLLGKGDMLFLASDAPKAERVQGAYVADDEVERLAHFWSAQATALGLVPAQWTLPDADDDNDLLDFTGDEDDDDEPIPAWQRPHNRTYGARANRGKTSR